MKKYQTSLVQTIHGPMLVLDSDLAQTSSLRETHRPNDHAEIERMRERLIASGRKGAFLDIGACLGGWTLALASAECLTEIHAFEPQHILSNLVCASIALNGHTHVWCRNLLVGKDLGQVAAPQFDYAKENNFGSINFHGTTQEEPLVQPRLPDNGQTVGMTTVDRFCGRCKTGPVIFMKIDVEGMELEVLAGAAEVIARDRPILYVEFIKSDKGALAAALDALGYDLTEEFSDFLCLPRA